MLRGVRRSLLAAALFALLLLLVFHPPVLGIGGEVRLPGWDATRVFWADIVHLRRCVLNGELPLWLSLIHI